MRAGRARARHHAQVAPDLPETARVREADRRERVEAWGLVLASQGISSQAIASGSGFALHVAAVDLGRAQEALDAYERENASGDGHRRPPRREWGSPVGGLVLALLLLAVWAATGAAESASPAFRHGSASAARVLGGEWWRALTALTLHVDWPHVLANTVSCALFAGVLSRSLGPGVTVLGMLVAGALANVGSAAVHGGTHVAVGASSAIFGAVGMLGGVAAVERRRLGRSPWIPLAGVAGLLAMLGTGGARTDWVAHLGGLGVGVALGATIAALSHRAARAPVQGLCGLAAAAALAGAWLLALR